MIFCVTRAWIKQYKGRPSEAPNGGKISLSSSQIAFYSTNNDLVQNIFLGKILVKILRLVFLWKFANFCSTIQCNRKYDRTIRQFVQYSAISSSKFCIHYDNSMNNSPCIVTKFFACFKAHLNRSSMVE